MSCKGNQGNEQGQPPVNLVDLKWLTHVYHSENQESSTSELQQAFGVSKQAVNKRMKRLAALGFIEKIKGAENIYKFHTQQGSSTSFSEGVTIPHIRSHAIGFKAKLYHEGLPLKLQNQRALNNWLLSEGKIDGLTVQKTTKHLIVWAKEIRGANARENERKALNMVWPVFQKLAERYDLEIGLPELVQKPHHAVISTMHKRIAQQVLSNVGTVSNNEGFIDDSEKTGGEIEVTTADHADIILNSGKVLSEIRGLLIQTVGLQQQQARQISDYATHLNAHIPVLRKMSKLIDKLDKRIGQRSLKEFGV